MRKPNRLILLWKLLALEALFNHQSGQRRGWFYILEGSIERAAWSDANRQAPARLNVTPPFAGLLLGMWRKDLMGGPKKGGGPFPVETLSSTLSARADRLLWGSVQPAVFSVALMLALLGGSGSPLAVPILWIVFVIGWQVWGWRQSDQRPMEALIGFIGSPRWAIWERRMGRLRRIAVGAVLGYWIAGGEGSGMEPYRYAAPVLGLIFVLVWKVPPLRWGIVALFLALGFGLFIGPGSVVP
ncbi:MAG: hypothetical protein KJ970_02815 [Candidatus Eisenbacteria bacterium]|uniref:Uncharacterized protein n=1 Tax=Eiseniibacteriota bacterium TaxID=2212470 RepID=A0A948RVQ8_UNCEI|nr:hypothetical protein [Candidatus Eisenbacteria bacterium]MBU1950122.1 hypothetical protein [Candidatus Eisenbacteria bacterium]MBU2689832.1 hypothetical protein [Candidatus Eisenbacteria bacterium]